MRLAKIEWNGACAAIVEDDELAVVGSWKCFGPGAPTMRSEPIARIALGEASFLPPIDATSKIICLGLNYRDHANEGGEIPPETPALFTKFADALVGHESGIVRPAASDSFDYEGEIAVVIGRGGRHIAAADALDHVFGYSIFLDGSVRDYQRHSISAGKNFWHSGAIGPWIVTADEIADPSALTLQTHLNGALVQRATAGLMIHDIPSTIAYVSRWTPLLPGDIIATGTPAGVGAARTPPLWMREGDRVEVSVSAIGSLRNHVIAEALPQ